MAGSALCRKSWLGVLVRGGDQVVGELDVGQEVDRTHLGLEVTITLALGVFGEPWAAKGEVPGDGHFNERDRLGGDAVVPGGHAVSHLEPPGKPRPRPHPPESGLQEAILSNSVTRSG